MPPRQSTLRHKGLQGTPPKEILTVLKYSGALRFVEFVPDKSILIDISPHSGFNKFIVLPFKYVSAFHLFELNSGCRPATVGVLDPPPTFLQSIEKGLWPVITSLLVEIGLS